MPSLCIAGGMHSMPSGHSCWMMNLLVHTSTALLSSVCTGLYADFTLEYSHTLLIILRSEQPEVLTSYISYMQPFRLLISLVKKGHHPCPCCLTPVWKFWDMGMLHDRKYCNKLGRKDDFLTRHTVANARNAIYQGQYAVDGKKISKILGDQSLAPVAVGISAWAWVKPC